MVSQHPTWGMRVSTELSLSTWRAEQAEARPPALHPQNRVLLGDTERRTVVSVLVKGVGGAIGWQNEEFHVSFPILCKKDILEKKSILRVCSDCAGLGSPHVSF